MQTVKNTFLKAYILYIKAIRALSRTPPSEIVLIPPASKGSLGDQALLQGIQNYFCTTQEPVVRQALPRGFEEIPLLEPCLPSFNVTAKSLKSDLQFLNALTRARMICMPGADVMDGRYNVDQTVFSLYCLDLAARAGVPSRLLGFSFSSEPRPEVVQRFKSLSPAVRCFARDPVSKARFERATGRTIGLVADLAFLVTPSSKSETARTTLDWISRQRTSPDVSVIGLNANALTLKESPEKIIRAYVDLIEKLSQTSPQSRFVFIPHDFRRGNDDEDINSAIVSNISQEHLDKIYQTKAPLDAWDAKAIAKACDLVVTGRMHLAIAALGSGTPVIGIGYMGKFEGMLGYFSLNDSLVTPREAYTDLRLPDIVLHHLKNINEINKNISSNLPTVREMSLKNFEGITTE